MIIGMDIGTTQCKTAYLDDAGKPVPVLNEDGATQTPSVLHVSKSGEVLIGQDAVEQGYLDPEGLIRGSKLLLGSAESLVSRARGMTATEAAAALIARQKANVERVHGKELTECVATCPANFRDDSKQALIEAFRANDVNVLKLITEPAAAAFAYASQLGSQKARVLIYDFGGGTFDVSIIEKDGPQITVLATAGIAKLGGNDLNEPIRRRILHELGAQFGSCPSMEDDALLHMDIAQRAEAAKLALNKRKEVPCVIGYKGSQVVVSVTQEEYHRDVASLIAQSLEVTDQAMEGAGLDYGALDHLVMVGGTSRLLHIQERLREHTGKAPKVDIDPDKAIAYGAALACAVEIQMDGRTPSHQGQVIPAPDMFVTEVTAHDVGCCVLDGGKGGSMVNSVIVPKNTAIPHQKVEHYYLIDDTQQHALIEILQGKAGAVRDECLVVGEVCLENLPPEPVRSQRIQVRYVIDGNGMVTVTATDKVSGIQQSVTVDYKQGVRKKGKPDAA